MKKVREAADWNLKVSSLKLKDEIVKEQKSGLIFNILNQKLRNRLLKSDKYPYNAINMSPFFEKHVVDLREDSERKENNLIHFQNRKQARGKKVELTNVLLMRYVNTSFAN